MEKDWTHAELCKKAAEWLKRPQKRGGPGCHHVFLEVTCSSNDSEIVDVIGLKTAVGMETIVIEVKTSRADFLADKKNTFRLKPELGMGNFRYLLCTEGLIKVSELPERWGLLVVGHRGKIIPIYGHINGNKDEWHFNTPPDAELAIASLLHN